MRNDTQGKGLEGKEVPPTDPVDSQFLEQNVR